MYFWKAEDYNWQFHTHLACRTPLTVLHLWLYRLTVVWNVWSQELHEKGLSSRCLLLWFWRLHFTVKDLSHSSHENGLSSVCVLWWTISDHLVVEDFPHSSQGNLDIELISSSILVTYFGSLTTWQRILCSFTYCSTLKDFSHWSQENGFSSECTLLWTPRIDNVLNDFLQSSQG